MKSNLIVALVGTIALLLTSGCMKIGGEVGFRKAGDLDGGGGGGGNKFAFNGTIGVATGPQILSKITKTFDLDLAVLASNATVQTQVGAFNTAVLRTLPVMATNAAPEAQSDSSIIAVYELAARAAEISLLLKQNQKVAGNPFANVNLAQPANFTVAIGRETFSGMYKMAIGSDPTADQLAANDTFMTACLASATKNATLIRACIAGQAASIMGTPAFMGNN